MDSSFDRLTRLFAAGRSRRTLGGLVLGCVTGLLGLTEAEAACPKGRKRCKKRCIPKRKCCTNAQCRPAATGRVCNKRGRCVCRAARPKKCNGRCIPHTSCCLDSECPIVPRGRTGCRNGACVIVACDAGFGNCTGDVANGCETDLRTNVNHCGACGVVCPGSTPDRCMSGICQSLPPRLISVSVPDPVQIGEPSVQGTVTLDGPAQGDTTVVIESNDTARATVANALVLDGGTTGSFSVTGVSTGEVTVSATLPPDTVTDTFEVVEP